MGKTENKVPEPKTISRGPGGWSLKQPYQKDRIDEAKVDDGKNKEMNSQNNKFLFQRTWSQRRLSYADGYMGPTKTSTLRAQENNGSAKKMKSISSMKKSSSQNDLNADPHRSIPSVNVRMTPSVSTSSIPSEVCSK